MLIQGESGVGKDLIARRIHEESPRRARPFVKVDCASIPRDQFEGELFGHVSGAVPGAMRDRTGHIELAEGGTLFLDEVGDVPSDLQVKLLRPLQDSTFERVGNSIDSYPAPAGGISRYSCSSATRRNVATTFLPTERPPAKRRL